MMHLPRSACFSNAPGKCAGISFQNPKFHLGAIRSRTWAIARHRLWPRLPHTERNWNYLRAAPRALPCAASTANGEMPSEMPALPHTHRQHTAHQPAPRLGQMNDAHIPARTQCMRFEPGSFSLSSSQSSIMLWTIAFGFTLGFILRN